MARAESVIASIRPDDDDATMDPNDDAIVRSILETNSIAKPVEGFRSYGDGGGDGGDDGDGDGGTPKRVLMHYRDMRTYQTVEFHDRMATKYSFENGKYRCVLCEVMRLMTIEEAFVELEDYVDASDPDMDLPNLLHLLQTAEGIRKSNHPDWFQLVGLLHDMGKIMFLWGNANDGQDGYASDENSKQWALGGDTFVVGCRIPDEAVVLPRYNRLNPDMADSRYNTDYGMYEPNCGLDALKFSWGHDEYMYRMLVANDCLIPREGLDMIRYHSAYPWHDRASPFLISFSLPRRRGAYRHLMKPEDYDRIKWVKLFNKFDLYTKDEGNELRGEKMQEELWPYYKGLLDKYGLGGKLKW
ncbi:hypothetical protein ACHAXA_006825 [Cyclostephanos tholiformis]|uniref:Inositol oxygenase n=1 Tax=Cyclostephanos tholiformis TaxID=382380 RepID=A0ABD3RT20_9STRA